MPKDLKSKNKKGLPSNKSNKYDDEDKFEINFKIESAIYRS